MGGRSAPAGVLADVAEGFVTPEAALAEYGLEITKTNGEWSVVAAPGRNGS